MTAISPVEFHTVSLAYRRPHDRAASLKEHAVHLLRRQTRYETLLAVRDVSFRAEAGQMLGVIGPNGAGKSTIMKLIARVIPPTRGRVIVRGRVAAMIELAAGLDPELTTCENILLYAALLGRNPEDISPRIPRILEWAGLEGLDDVPVRTFSSGMMARLGFAVCIDSEPDVLVVDEVLSVGDEAFQRRSMERIQAMIRRGSTVILVSHALALVERVADRVLWLQEGRKRMLGDPREVIRSYRSSLEPPPVSDRLP